ncbi:MULTISPECIES: hypothetical protein [Chryseobacterium]|uniref:Uncharacterized protein n=1 Tax=Chryseobacterium taihuense TaxID=1141221 RepID=A0A1G9QR34_9FLAO|nr:MULTISPECIES: hypothetical protein [Chryseobacterium]QQV03105.1 hypothetical protein I6I61_01735 [Chryseobacterium sp. FDAARGOS 1104]SDM13454.1 hypothetical protein SAMN05216273_11433 [Chryseobacterium taihuense]VFB03595.1 Uncharacterised protein [Chryseobacterium taihuense]
MSKFEIYLYNEVNNPIFDFFVKEITNQFKGVLIKKIDDGLETMYYDFNVDEILITLHQTPMIGITIFPTNNVDLKGGEVNFFIKISSYLKNKINDKI